GRASAFVSISTSLLQAMVKASAMENTTLSTVTVRALAASSIVRFDITRQPGVAMAS
ncbi:hypothetical protein BDW02DRAFT_509303, partial [Decorospora gaudefroyi]